MSAKFHTMNRLQSKVIIISDGLDCCVKST